MAMDAAHLKVLVTADTSKAESGLNSFSSKLQGTARNLGGISAGMSLAITAPIVGAAAAVFDVGKDFESAFTGVIKTFSGTAAEAEVLRQGILDMANVLPATAVEIAAVAESAGALGIAKENVLDFTRTIIDMAEATDMTAEQASNDMARFANIMQMPQDQFSNMGSAVVALGNSGASTESEIMSMGMRIAGVGAVVEMSEAQLLGWASAMASVGLQPEAAGTAFSTFVSDMAKEVATGGKKLKGFAKVAGVSAEDFAEAFGEDASAATLMFIEGLAGINEMGGNVFGTLEELGLGDRRVSDTLLRLSGNTDLITASIDTSNTAWEENIALAREAELRYATTDSKMAIMQNRIKDVGITLFDTFKPAINAGLDGISDFALGLGDAISGFAEANPALVSAAAAFAGVLAVAGPLVGVAAAVAFALSALGTAAAPILVVTAAVAALAAAFAGNFMGIRDVVMGVVETVRPHFETLLGWISSAAQGDFGPLKAGLQGALTSVSTAIAEFKWSDFVTQMGEWGTYITAVVWPDFISTLADWSVFVSNIVWSAYITSLSWDTWIDDFLWDTYVFLLTWDSYVTSLDWTGFVTALIDWGTWIPAIAWNSFVTVIDWATYIGAFVWSEYLSKVDWAAFITSMGDWSAFVGSLEWDAYVTSLNDWTLFVATLTWESFIEKLEWPALAELDWSVFIPDVNWSGLIPQLTWTDVIAAIVDWSAWIPALAWNAFVAVLDWAFLTTIEWGTYIATLNWSDIITTISDWNNYITAVNWALHIAPVALATYVATLDWGGYITALRSWDAWISEIFWSSFIEKINWPLFITEVNWSAHIEKLEWASHMTVLDWAVFISVLSWASYANPMRWDDYIADITWSNFVSKLSWPSASEILAAIVAALKGGLAPGGGSGGIPGIDKLVPEIDSSGIGTLEIPEAVITGTITVPKTPVQIAEGIIAAIRPPTDIPPIPVPVVPDTTIPMVIPPFTQPMPVPIVPDTTIPMVIPPFTDPIAVPIQLERITEQDMAGVIETSTTPITIPVTPKIVWPTGGQLSDILRERDLGGSAAVQEISMNVEVASAVAGPSLQPLLMDGQLNKVDPPAVMPVIQVKGEMVNDLSQAGAGIGDAAAAGAAALSSSLSGFSWPALPQWVWPAMPIFNWPALPQWTWPPIPAPTWLNQLVLPRPTWLGELLSWRPEVILSLAATPTAPGALAGGTNYWRGGPTWVGEKGPELLNLPKGTRVTDHENSMAAASGGNVSITINATVSNDQDWEEVAHRLVRIMERKDRGLR